MGNIIQSAGGIVYYLDTSFQPRYLLLKRQTKTKKIERVAPKGKIHPGETLEHAAHREVVEETGLTPEYLIIQDELGSIHLRNDLQNESFIDKDTTYFLIKYTGNPLDVRVVDAEGYVGMYKRATIDEALQLVYYLEMRELIRKAHMLLQSSMKKNSIKEHFLHLLAKD